MQAQPEETGITYSLGPKLYEVSRKEETIVSFIPVNQCCLWVIKGRQGKRGFHSSIFNFLWGAVNLVFHLLTRNICISDTVIDSFPNKLMETADDELSLVDTGFFINTSYPPLLRSKREVDVILHLNYSGGSQTLVREVMASEIRFCHFFFFF